MRRFLVLGALAALALAALSATAGARTKADFVLIAKDTHSHQVDANHFAVRGKLLEQGNRSEVEGTFKALFNRNHRIRAVAYLEDGKIKVDGHGKSVPIIAGTGHWEGAKGTLKTEQLSKSTTRLTFDIDQ